MLTLRFVHTVVDGHKSILAFGFMGAEDGVPVVAMLGRVCISVLGMATYFMGNLPG